MNTLIFGDSFIGPFTLLDDNNIKIYKFKGATMRGITKETNETRKKIITLVNNNHNYKCIIFNFGQVDIFFSYYYKKYIQKKKFMIDQFTKKYVEFIYGLNCNNSKKIIFAVYPTTIKDENVFNTLLAYGILSDADIKLISKSDIQKTSNFNFRYTMYAKINNLLKKYCNIYKLTFINLDNVLLNKNKRLKSMFIDPMSAYNIHLLWEPLIPILVSRITKCITNKKYKIDLKKSMKKFIKLKIKDISKDEFKEKVSIVNSQRLTHAKKIKASRKK
jgi:hypothetical protein